MNILSLFDGCSCGRVALERAGISIDKYFASEIDPYAIEIAKKNYPDTVHIGSVTGLIYEDGAIFHNQDNEPMENGGSYITDIDMIIGGPPCQDLSIAKQNRKGLDGEKSRLFYEYLRILKGVKPKYFLMENVASMPKSEREKIDTAILEIYPDAKCHKFNSSLVSAQQRKRLYWTNIPGVEEPYDLGVTLRDIIEDIPFDDPMWKPLEEKYLSEKGKLYLREKSLALTATYERSCPRDYIRKSNRQIIVGMALRNRGEGKVPEINGSDKANSLTTVQTDSVILRIGNTNPSGRGMNGEIYHIHGKSPTLTTNKGEGVKICDSYYWRKLTPLECERLQTLPDGYTEGVSNRQRYKMIGNGWTVDIIAHILSFLSR